jgi:hypothetical protein
VDPSVISSLSFPRLREGVEILRIGDEGILYETDSGKLHQLDTIASMICDRFDGSTSIRAAAGEFAVSFSADRGTVEDDILGLARQLAELDLLASDGCRSQDPVG